MVAGRQYEITFSVHALLLILTTVLYVWHKKSTDLKILGMLGIESIRGMDGE
jgi:hypothetical protein